MPNLHFEVNISITKYWDPQKGKRNFKNIMTAVFALATAATTPQNVAERVNSAKIGNYQATFD